MGTLPIIATYRDYLQRKGCAAWTVEAYCQHVGRALAHPEGPLGYLEGLERWQAWHHAAYALRRYARMAGDPELRAALADLEVLGPPGRSPRRPLVLPTPAEWVDAMRRAWAVPGELGAILYLVVASGLRVGDVLGLTRERIRTAAAEGSATTRQKGTRGERIRVWRPGPIAHCAVVRLARTLSCALAWQAISVSRRGAYQRIAGWCGSPHHPHVYRHATITYLVRAGVPLTTIQQITGHESLSALERYIHLHIAVDALAVDDAQSRMLSYLSAQIHTP